MMEIHARIQTGMAALPPELLSQIFGYLAECPPSERCLHDQPSPSMLSVPVSRQVLKPVSLVSKRWRGIVLPLLFRHVLWAFDRWDLVLASAPEFESDHVTALPALDFLRKQGLAHAVSSLTLVIGDSMHGMYRLTEAGQSADTSATVPSTSASASGVSFGRLLSLADARASQKNGIGLRISAQGSRGGSLVGEDNNWFWTTLFELMDPLRITFIASPRMLASLLSRMLFLGDAWSFRSQQHILSLSRDSRHKGAIKEAGDVLKEPPGSAASDGRGDSVRNDKVDPTNSKCRTSRERTPTILFNIRPWTAILLNEGSSTRVYKTYEFFLKRPPSILGSLLGCEEAPNDTVLVPSTVRSFSYVGIFPLSSHFNTLIAHLPRIDRLFVQLVPRNGILDDRDEMRNIQVADLWMERNTCYSMVMRELSDPGDSDSDMDVGADSDSDEDGAVGHNAVANPSIKTNNWKYLRIFESGDAADKEAWDMAVEYVRRSGTGWRDEREGVFVKKRSDNAEDARPARHEDAASSAQVASSNALTQSDDGEFGEGFELLSVPSSPAVWPVSAPRLI